jgi:carbohydrate diacid regulator
MLAAALAQEIAADTTAVIGFNVLITDSDGTVIGSGDQSRVGSFHEASVEVVQRRELVSHTLAQAHALRGVRPGVTLPLVVDGQVVGTVGITGAPAQVKRFGLVVRRQTEILLQESAALRSRLLRERALEDLMTDISAYDAEVVEPDAVQFRASELGYDLRLPRVAVAIDVSVAEAERGQRRARPERASTLRPELLRTVREVFADPQDIVASVPSGQFGVLHRVSREHLRSDGDAAVAAACRRLVDSVDARHGLAARTATGTIASDVAGLHESYRDACDALRLGARVSPGVATVTIGDLRVHQVLSMVGHGSRIRLVELVAGPLRAQPDWPVLRATIVAWCESGFSLVRAATALHVHRNTLVYRLGKIEELGGRSLRDHRGCLSLYLACLADQLDEQDSTAAVPARRRAR